MLKDLCIVILENPYTTLSQEEAKIVFSNMIATKIKGYTAIHSNNVMPVDATDFIATHVIVSNKENPFEEIYMSYKSISYKACERYNLTFPFMYLLKNYAHPDCFKQMDEFLGTCKSKDEDLTYDTGWTINPIVREDKILQSYLKEMISMFAINQHRDYGIKHWVTLGICKVKTDQHFLQMGLKDISSEPILKHPFLHNAESRAVISINGEYTDFVFETAKKYQYLWDNRITINLESHLNKTKKAA